ncbi:26039_t:CDS:2, partial [Racocetra persica]
QILPISKLLGGKCERTRLVAQLFTKSKKYFYDTICIGAALRAASGVWSTSFEPTDGSARLVWRSHILFVLVRPGWPPVATRWYTTTATLWPECWCIISNMAIIVFFSLIWSKKDDKNKEPKGKDIVCYLCEGKGHFASDIEMVKGRGPPVYKEFSMFGDQLRPKALSFYREEECWLKKELE